MGVRLGPMLREPEVFFYSEVREGKEGAVGTLSVQEEARELSRLPCG